MFVAGITGSLGKAIDNVAKFKFLSKHLPNIPGFRVIKDKEDPLNI